MKAITVVKEAIFASEIGKHKRLSTTIWQSWAKYDNLATRVKKRKKGSVHQTKMT